jgi:Protein of unknown function (DUF2855)
MDTRLLVRKDALHTTQIATTADAALQEGQVRVRVDKFSFTSNNITYAAFGDAMKYWQFFPTGQEGWGNIPVWGFGTVVQSSHPGVAVGERLYGYWPFATHAVLSPGKLSDKGFSDTAAHRAELHPVYNSYMRCSTDPFYTADTEDIQALLRPLFITSFLIDDFLADNAFFGANTLLLSSASSKTAYGTAHQLHQRGGIEVVGLTSERNRAFCESLGCYHRVLSYEQLGEVAQDAACVYVDFAGNADLRRAIHTRFGKLAYSCSIGGTHVEHLGGGRDLPGPKATLFFAPAQIKKRYADWGPEAFGRSTVTAWRTFCTTVSNPAQPWLTVEHHHGVPAAEKAYAQVLAGMGDARVGHMISLHNS